MVKDSRNKGYYSEEYDYPALKELAELAKRYEDTDGRAGVPDGTFSDFSCGVWELMTELVRYGKTH